MDATNLTASLGLVKTVKNVPENCGRRLLPTLIDKFAKNGNPTPYASISNTSDVEEGFRDITYSEFANAINKCANILVQALGHESKTFAYAGLHDIHYSILAVAAMKSGHKCFFTSPRNSVQAQKKLIAETGCVAFVKSFRSIPIVDAIFRECSLQVIYLPHLDDLLDCGVPSEFLFAKTFQKSRFDVCCILHTSGSTEMPQAVSLRLGCFCVIDTFQQYSTRGDDFNWSDVFRDRRVLMAFPGFHSAGLCLMLAGVVYFNMTAVMPPPGPLTAELVDAVHVHGDIQASMIPGPILVDLVRNPTSYDNLGNLAAVAFGGAPIGKDTGDAVKQKTYPFNIIGTTEACPFAPVLKDPSDWEYFKYSPFMGYEFRHTRDGLYEMVFVRDEMLDLFQCIFVTFPELQEWSTRDLYSKHPTKLDHWLYRGRLDDVIVFSNGEKLNPVAMEAFLMDQPNVAGALVVGNRRFQSALIIEPKRLPQSKDEERAMLKSLLPAVKKANEGAAAHGKILEDHIMLTPAGKPLPRAGKGSILRGASEELFGNELNILYRSADKTSERGTGAMQDIGTIQKTVTGILEQWPTLKALHYDADFFSSGMDSLQTIQLTRSINNTFPGVVVSPRLVYANPTARKFCEALFRVLNPKWCSFTGEPPTSKKLAAICDSCTRNMPITTRDPSAKPRQMTVIITGSTGHLGSYLLHNLSSSSLVERVFCLNRAHPGIQTADRQARLQSSRGLDAFPSHVEFYDVDLSKPKFNLPIADYKKLLRSTTHVIHNAWAVHFNHPLDSFIGNHVFGVRALVDFHAHASHAPFIYFLSSVGAMFGWPHPSISVPEAVVPDTHLPGDMGYAQSKWIGECILQAAATALGTGVGAVCRIGQIAGPVAHHGQGAWPKREWFPTLVAASAALGLVPQTLGPLNEVDWLPVDTVADAILALLVTASNAPAQHLNQIAVHNLVNPSRVSYSTRLLPVLLRRLPNARPVPLAQWVTQLRTADLACARALLPFFEELARGERGGMRMPVFASDRAERESKGVLSACGPVTEAWLEEWLSQWGY